jgi:PKD repeat protein
LIDLKNISIIVVIFIITGMMLAGCNDSLPSYDGSFPPIADFTASPTSGGIPLTVQFSDLSTGNFTEWAWDFDNNGVVDSIEKNPSYVYQNEGKYTVSLRVTGPGGSDNEIKNKYIRVQDFELTEWKLLGENGYAVLYIKFNTLGGITIRFMNPVGTLVDVESVEEDVVGAAAKLKMDNQWEVPKAGQYTLVVRDALGEDIFEKTFDFQGSDVTMSDLAIKWQVILVGEFWAQEILFEVANNGDLPSCIYNCELSLDDKSKTISTKHIILPDEQKTIVKSSIGKWNSLFTLKESGEKTAECTLLDKADTVIATYSGKIMVS